MTETKQESVAYFRYAMIHPMLDPGCTGKKRADYIASVTGKEQEIPFSTKRMVREGTLKTWLARYRQYGVEGLKPRGRSDRGASRQIGGELGTEILAMKESHPEMTLVAVVQRIERERPDLCPKKVPMGSAYRFYSQNAPSATAEGGIDRRRFEMEHCNDCWEVDGMDGPKAIVENFKDPKKVFCFGIIDDKSRLICHAEFYPDEKAESLLDCLWKAFNKRGLPRMIFTDNGSAMRDARLKLGCAELEIHLAYSRPYTPQGKAKIERMWRTLQMQFLPTLPQDPIPLYELNKRLDRYIDAYNKRVHSTIGMAPLERFMDDLKGVRPAPPELPGLFRNRIERKVSLARTVSIDNRLYEVPLGYSGVKIELRYLDLSSIEAFFEGKSIGFLSPVDLVGNSMAHRHGKGGCNG